MRNVGKAQNHHKYLMGGIVAKYFPECYQYEEKELNVILSAALASAECRQAVENVKRMENNADEMEDEKTETAVTPMKRRQKKTAADTPIQKILRVAVFAGRAVSPGVWVHPSYGCTDRPQPVWSCAALRGHLRVGVACLAPVKRGNNLSLRPLRFLPLCILCICP